MRLSSGVLLIDYFSKTYSISKWKCNQILVLIVTFFIYIVYHMSRRSISIVKPVLHHKHNCTRINDRSNDTNSHWCDWAPFDKSDGMELLGWLDTSYLTSYAIGLFFAGYVADRSNLRYFLSISLIVCGIFNILFGIAYPLKIHDYYYFIIIQALSGLAQATGWPAVLSAVGNWFGKDKKGLVFGIWSWHTSIGNIVGAAIAGAFVDFNWGLSFTVPGIICILMGVFTFLFLIPGPQYVEHYINEDNLILDDNNEETDNEAISFVDALKVQGVIEYSICIFFNKLVSYTFLFWLPELINQTINVSASDSAYLSISFDIGGAVGAIIAGFIADKSNASGLTSILLYTCGIPSLLAFYKWGAVSMVINQCLQFIAGLFVNGPYTLIMSAVAADLGTKVKTKNALATISAIIDGIGSIGAVIGPLIASYLDDLGMQYLFYTLIACNMLSIGSILRISYREFRTIIKKRQSKFDSINSN